MSTTPYAVSINKGSVSWGGGYVNAPITGPLNTSQAPCHMPYHSYGLLPGVNPTPPQFYPSQEPVYSDMGVNARYQYLRTSGALPAGKILAKMSPPMSYYIHGTSRQAAVSTHMNYIAPIPSSMHVNQLKANAVGQSAYKVGLPTMALTGTKSYYPSGTRSSLRRARSGGCVAPKKKGAIENTSLRNGMVCSWGSIVRQNY